MIPLVIFGLFVLFTPAFQAASSQIPLQTDFRSPRKIGFSAVGGGASHYHWVLSILQEMQQRGHEATLYTRSDSIGFADGYPGIQTQTVGGDLNFLAVKNQHIGPNTHLQHETSNPARFIRHVLPSLLSNYSNEYLEFETIIKDKKIDLMLCDVFALACMDATVKSKIPLVVTATFACTPDTSNGYVNTFIPSFGHPTTETMSIWLRLRHHFYTWYIPFQVRRLHLPAHTFQKQRGIPLTSSLYNPHTKSAFKLVNNMFGIEAARPVGPLTELIGPIMRPHYPDLDTTLADFLGKHQQVIYVAFGQHATPTTQDTAFLVRALTQQLAQGTADGILWATRPGHPVPEFVSFNASILITGWVPQFAILRHPSLALFITHGGAASIHEGLFNKVPLFVYPYFGDQPVTARMVRRQQLGDSFDTAGMVYTEAIFGALCQRIHTVLTDPVIRQTVERYGNALQVRSLGAVQRGADVLEEIVFGAVDDQILHRIDVGDGIAWYKRTNLDLVVIILFGLAVVLATILKLFRLLTLVRKIKTL